MTDDWTEDALDPMGGPRRSRRRSGQMLFWIFLALLVGAGAWILRAPHDLVEPPTPEELGVEEPRLVVRPVMLYFGDRSGRSFVTEERDLAVEGPVEARMEAVLRALVEGPGDGDAVRTLPAEAAVRRIFFDDETATAYADFDPALVTRQPGGSAAEHATLAAIARTLGANFPEVARVQILVDGEPVESLAGHFDTSKPLEIATWQ